MTIDNPFKVSFTLHGDLASELRRAVTSAQEALQQFGHVIESAARRMRTLPIPAPHAFAPNFDLCCTVPGCGLGPEEH